MHGFMGEHSTAAKYCRELVTIGDFNCIAVDWTSYAHNINYYRVKFDLNAAAEEVSDFIKILIEKGLKMDDLTLIGHSLGAHLSGRVSQFVSRKVRKVVGTIIGLDPAGPAFRSDKFFRFEYLTESDAKYVLVLHTDVRQYGIKEPIGHADVYVNWGDRQPGCRHIWWPYKDSLHCKALQCSQLIEPERTCVFKGVETIMGPNMTKVHGLFYLETKRKSPFVIPNPNPNRFRNVRFIRS